MADVHNKATRSKNMAAVKHKNTKLELLVRRYLRSQRLGYRIHVNQLPGTPDIVLSKYKTVIFVHGCLWHGHENCKKAALPKTRTEWWKNKIEGNIENDRKVFTALKEQGWRVMEVWGCELTAAKKEQTLEKLEMSLTAKK